MEKRLEHVRAEFHRLFGPAQPLLYSVPGRTELGGNHTDHQHGLVLAGAVDVDMLAAAAANNSMVVRVFSEGCAPFSVPLDCLHPVAGERGHAAALVRGVCSGIADLGYLVQGFDLCVSSRIPQGCGLSSSAAFEVMAGAVVNGLFCGGALDATALALVGQAAENRFFLKPCGLMDQLACAWGGIVSMDFRQPPQPAVKTVAFDFAASGHSLCLVNVGASHAGLSHEYAAIPGELARVSGFFGKAVLRDVAERDFYDNLAALRAAAGDRAVLRAIHVYQENRRVQALCAALEQGDFPQFLKLIRASGRSSWMYLQNVAVSGSTEEQPAALALALCDRLLGNRGAFRIHGGGFGGTVQAFVPDDMLPVFQAGIEAVFGPGSCRAMKIRSKGILRLE